MDGGSPITGYVVEMRPISKKAWTKVEDTKSLELTASKLTQGTEYLFRVAAQNAVGIGDFTELQKPAVPKGEFGEQTVVLNNCFLLFKGPIDHSPFYLLVQCGLSLF